MLFLKISSWQIVVKALSVPVCWFVWLAIWCLLIGCGSGPKEVGPESGHEKMVRILAELAEKSAAESPFQGGTELARMRAAILSEDPAQRVSQLYDLGIRELFVGNVHEAIVHLESAWEISKSLGAGLSGGDRPLYYLGVANLRLAETQNCCERHTAESCILPLERGGVHTREEGSLAAIKWFTEYLELSSVNPADRQGVMWLLNVAYMTLGDYPAGVPKQWRIKPEVLFGSNIFPRFANVAGELGLDTFNLSGGMVTEDLNNDHHLDVLTTTWDLEGDLNLHLSNGDGTFTRQDVSAIGLAGIGGGLNMVQADYNNDGWVDILILRGAWLGKVGRHPNSLLRNNGLDERGQLSFTDVTHEVGLADVNFPTQCAGWADYDNDGDLDLYVGNECEAENPFPSQLFRNEGISADGQVRFTDVTWDAGVANMGLSKGVTWGDYDADGWMDLYVSNLGERNRLYRNMGDSTFKEVAAEQGVDLPLNSFPAWFWDFNNDGVLDLFVGNYPKKVGIVAAYYTGSDTDDNDLCGFYEGTRGQGFRNVARKVNVDAPMMPMGSNFGDLNNDGFLDFYLGTGNPDYASVMPNRMFVNRAGLTFEDVTIPGGFGHLQKGHAIAFADIDGDGDQDVLEQMGGAYPGDGYYDAVFENPGFGNHWISIHLVGTRSNRSAIGTRVKVRFKENDGTSRTVYRQVSSGGSFGAHSLRLHIGLGKAVKVDQLEILWPLGEARIFEAIPVDCAIQVVEGKDQWRVL